MPGFDERLKQQLERLAPPADPSGAYDRVVERKIRRRLVRRLQAAGLAFVVFAATVGGTFALVRVFRSDSRTDRLGHISPTPVLITNGRIAYWHEGESADVWTINPDGSQAKDLTADSSAAEYTPAWSPDGTRIAFIRERNSDPTIYVMDADGANATPVRPLAVSNHDLAWAPDGDRIAYTNRGDIFVMNADGSGSRRITQAGPQAMDFHPTWSPDGARIAFARYLFDQPFSNDPFVGQSPSGSGIYVVKLDGGDVTRLTEGPNPDTGLDEWPDWSPDGKEIVFQRASDIYVMDIPGSGLTKLTSGGNSSQPSWSPDQEKIVFQRDNPTVGLSQLYVMNADGSGVTRLPIQPTTDFSPDWQPLPVSPSPMTTPPISLSPTPSPLAAKCDASQASGDFDGDGQPDTATVARTECFPGEPGGAGSTTEYSLHVRWPPSEGIVPLPDCRKVCRAVAAADLNGDGIDEFILQVDAGASTDFFHIYELPASEAFGRPAVVAPPGSQRWPPDAPAEFSLFGSVLHFSALGCNLTSHQIIVKDVGVNEAQTKYLIHESILRFEAADSPPFGRFTVVSERDYTEPFDQGVGPGDQFEPGDPCWAYGS